MRRRPALTTAVLAPLVVGVALLAATLVWPERGPATASEGNTITTPDDGGDVGYDSSLALDASGNPVVSYYDGANLDLKVLRCDDPNCAGDGESITSPDMADDVGRYTSLALDASGNPVVSYLDTTNGDLKVLHCNDPDCAGGDETITSPDTAGDVGEFTSLALDGSGNPVVSYHDETDGDLKLLHCNDPDCSGDDEIITSPDTGDHVGHFTSLSLDGSGNPVLSYYDVTNLDLKVMHCNDPNCAGDDESIASPDTADDVGRWTSLALDASGNPVVSYYDVTNGDLRVLHCDDPYCGGGGESITSPATDGDVGRWTSLALDASGKPVVSHYDDTNDDLKVLHCNDPNCSGDDETVTSPDTGGDAGKCTSLALDASGNPVVSYYDVTNGNLKVAHCDDGACVGGDESITTPDDGGRVGWYTSLALDGSGNPVVSYYDITNGDLKVLHCGNPDCTSGNSITSPHTDGDVGLWTSLALDGSGNPVVSYWRGGALKVMRCNDPNCAGDDESISSAGGVAAGWTKTSLALDASGNPVVAYGGSALEVLHCGTPDCTLGDVTSTVDSGGTRWWPSLALDASGNPVVSYQDVDNDDLKLLHCNDPNCEGDDESITSPDTGGDVGVYTSLALDASGNPVVSYQDVTNQRPKVLHCGNPNCTSGNSITSPDTVVYGGEDISLALDSSGNPVVSYYDLANRDLKVLHCNDPDCAGGDESTTSPDTGGRVGHFTSLALDGSGNPVVSYYDSTNSNLKILHCGNPDCAEPPTPTPTATVTNTPTPTATVTPTPTPSPVIELLAGTPGVFDFDGDGGPAQDALLNDPRGSFEVIDSNTLFFADTGNSRIRRISPNEPTGTITTVAGGGTPTPGFCGDGGPATDACLDHPYDVFADGPGNLYIADTDNNRIRVVNTQGQTIQVAGITIDPGEIETVAGTGDADYYGDGGPASSAKLNGPRGVAVDDSGSIFIADTENHRIRKVDTGGTITTVAGNGTPAFSGDGGSATASGLNRPHDVYMYGELGDFVIADTVNNRIRRVDGFMGVIDTYAGSGQAADGGDGGLATLAHLNGPEAIAVDSAHRRLPNVLIADTQNHRIRRVDGRSTIITTVAGDGTPGSGGDGGDPTSAQLNLPSGIAVGSYIGSDTGNSTLRAIDEQTGKPSGRFSGLSCMFGNVSTADWVLVGFVLGLILARRQIRWLTTQIRVVARLGARPGTPASPSASRS